MRTINYNVTETKTGDTLVADLLTVINVKPVAGFVLGHSPQIPLYRSNGTK